MDFLYELLGKIHPSVLWWSSEFRDFPDRFMELRNRGKPTKPLEFTMYLNTRNTCTKTTSEHKFSIRVADTDEGVSVSLRSWIADKCVTVDNIFVEVRKARDSKERHAVTHVCGKVRSCCPMIESRTSACWVDVHISPR